MAVLITHTKVATLPDEPGAEVNKAEWNDNHVVSGLGTAAEAATTDFDAAGAAAAVVTAHESTTNHPVFVASGASHAKGMVPDPGAVAGSTKFMREDATWAVPPSGSGTFAITQVEVDFGSTPVSDAIFTITDAAITPTMKIMIQQSYDAPTGKDQDENEMDQLVAVASAGTGQFLAYVKAIDGSYLADKFKFNYTAA